MNELTRANGLTAQREPADLIDNFIKFAQVSEKTAETYLKALRQMMNYFNLTGETQPTEETLIDWKNWLICHEEDGQEVRKAPATVNLYITACRRFFNWLEREGVYKDIGKYLKGVRIDRDPKKDYMTASQLRQVIGETDRDTVKGLRDYAILVLAITGGLRTIELTRADVKDLTVRGNNTVLYLQGKGYNDKNKFVIVPEETEQAIREYLKARGTTEGNEPLFASLSNNSKGGRMTTRAVSGVIKDYMKRAGFDSDRLTAHSLRHSSVTISLLEGATLEEARQHARHGSIATTQIYMHGIEADNNACSHRIEKALF